MIATSRSASADPGDKNDPDNQGVGIFSSPIQAIVFLSCHPVQKNAGSRYHGNTQAGSSILSIAAHAHAMLIVTGVIALLVYEYFGLAFLRHGWINVDLLWTAALILTGMLLLIRCRNPVVRTELPIAYRGNVF